MAEAKRTNAVFFANVTTRAYPCRFCRQTVDITELANGRFDAEGSVFFRSVIRTREENRTVQLPFLMRFMAGGVLALFIVNIVVGIMNWLLALGITLGHKANLVVVIIGAFGLSIPSAIASFKRRK